MANHTRREFTTHTVELTIHTPCDLRELYDLLAAARTEYRERNGIDPNIPMTSDAITTDTGFGRLVLSFEVTE